MVNAVLLYFNITTGEKCGGQEKSWMIFFELCAVVFSTAERSNCGHCGDTYRQLH